ncbi:MAG TPA: hypothetical protein PKD78_14130, partial [Saprospiraceae bacterium]|nr:hypothetical protein [Saprospiraceae bacterium]
AQEIASGVVKSDANGQFAIDFQALPDARVPKKVQPVFDYAVSVDVTDITGETRSTATTVSVAYSALQVSWGLENDMDLDSLKRVALKAANLADQPLPATGEITLQRLVAPKTPYIQRYWEAPDVATLQKADFKRLFPDYAYMDEDNPAKWDREDYLISIPFNTANTATVNLQNGRVQPGYYWVKLSTKDAYGEPVTLEKVLRVYDSKQPLTRFALPDHFVEKNRLEPGETARIWWGSTAASLLHVLYLRTDPDRPQPARWLSVRGAERVEMPIQEADRGGIALQSVAVLNNRIYGPAQIRIEVPWSNKDLIVSYETFRDKLAPGQVEEWRIKISGPKKDRVAAEMVAAMYDASLDQFLPHDWQRIGFPQMGYVEVLRNAAGFHAEQGYGQTINGQGEVDVKNRQYPLFNWFDFPFWGGPRRHMKMAAMTMARSRAPHEEMAMADMETVREESAQAVAGGMDIKFDMAYGNAAPPPPPAPAPAPAPPASI